MNRNSDRADIRPEAFCVGTVKIIDSQRVLEEIFHRETNEKTHPRQKCGGDGKSRLNPWSHFSGKRRMKSPVFPVEMPLVTPSGVIKGRGNPRTQWSFIAKSIVTSDLYPTFRAKTMFGDQRLL